METGAQPELPSETVNFIAKGEEAMKKFITIISVLAAASMVLVACSPKTASTGGTSGECGFPTNPSTGLPNLGGMTITVAVENAYPPFNSIDSATNQGIGWDYDASNEICSRLNCVVEFKQAAWDGIFPAMAAGEYDMLADGVTNYPYRYWAVDFSIPYSLVAQKLMVRTDETHTIDDFKTDANLKIGTQIGTTNYIAATEFFPGKDISTYSDFGAAVVALLAGDIDGIVLDDTVAAGYALENPGKLTTIGDVKVGDALAFVFPPGSVLVGPVNAALRAMHADGTLAQLNQTWGLAAPAEEPAE
jgi:polar amino acid transport system substrate-binding protein